MIVEGEEHLRQHKHLIVFIIIFSPPLGKSPSRKGVPSERSEGLVSEEREAGEFQSFSERGSISGDFSAAGSFLRHFFLKKVANQSLKDQPPQVEYQM